MHIGIRARSGVICGVPAHLLVGGFGGNPGGFPIIMNLPVSTDEAVERFSAVLGQEEFLEEHGLEYTAAKPPPRRLRCSNGQKERQWSAGYLAERRWRT